jgi:hypothetical protein
MVPTIVAADDPETPTMRSLQPSGRTRLTIDEPGPARIDQKHSIQGASPGLGRTSV